MDPLTQLGLLASIAATYSGFIAVFIAFTRDGRFEKVDGHFVQAMVLGTIGVIVMSLTPPVLSMLMPSGQMWLVVTALAIAGGVPSILYQAWHQSRLSKAQTGQISIVWHAPGWILGVLALAAFVAGLVYAALRPGLFVAGVSLMLATSIWCFVAVVFRRFF